MMKYELSAEDQSKDGFPIKSHTQPSKEFHLALWISADGRYRIFLAHTPTQAERVVVLADSLRAVETIFAYLCGLSDNVLIMILIDHCYGPTKRALELHFDQLNGR